MTKPKYQLMPELSKEEREFLERDIAERGIKIPVEYDEEGNILDGHNRIEIAKKLKIDCPKIVRKFNTEEEKISHVLALNMARRHLLPHQWGSACKKLLEVRGVKTGQGSSAEKRHSQSATIADIAKELGVPERTARSRIAAAEDYELLPEEDREKVDRGEKSARSAARGKKQEKKRKEAAKTAELKGKFSLIYADPPWMYGASTMNDGGGSADDHYPTMSTDEICNLGIKDHVVKDAVLFLWATNPLLPEAMRVIEEWGFKYKTNLVWVKDKATVALGEYVRGKHEMLLIATRGTMIPDKKDRPESVIEAPRGEHSRKPDTVYDMIESMYGNQRRLELFARSRRDGWNSFGAEVDGRLED